MQRIRAIKNREEEKSVRKKAIDAATVYAIEIPFKVMKLSLESMEIIKYMAENGNPNSVSDAGVGALCARSAVLGAYLNVRINAGAMKQDPYISKILNEASQISESAIKKEVEILSLVEQKLN